MPISWAPLELRKASNLRREVDEACKQFNEAVESGDTVQVKELRRAFAERIDELEDFYLKHDDDERAVLFEKQRLRLRRVLHASTSHDRPSPVRQQQQDQQQQQEEGAGAAAGEYYDSPAAGQQQQQQQQQQAHSRTPTGTGSSWAAPPGKHGRFSVMGGIHHPASVPGAGTDKGNKGQFGSTRASRSGSSSKATKDTAALYSWEKGGGGAADGADGMGGAGGEQREHPLSGRNFSGSGEPGHYTEAGASVDPAVFDLQVILTDAEQKLLLSRLRAKRAEDKHARRQKKALNKAGGDKSEYLFSQSPYIEPHKVRDALSRTPQKDKWVGDKSFSGIGKHTGTDKIGRR